MCLKEITRKHKSLSFLDYITSIVNVRRCKLGQVGLHLCYIKLI